MIRYFPVVKASYRASNAVQQSLSRKLLDLKKMKDEIPQKPSPMAILGYEMEPTYTFGRRQKAELSPEFVGSLQQRSRGAEVLHTLRGGHATFHGPGQLVLYPVLDLQKLGIKVRDYVCILEKSIVSVLKDTYGIAAEQRTGGGMNGVWISGTAQKIASVGVHVRRNVTSHGLSLNAAVDPFWFQQIVACNLPDAQMVSIADFQREQSPPLHVNVIGEQLAREIVGRIGTDISVETEEAAQKLLLDVNATSAEH